jgi:hypothetical protein
VRAAEGEEVLLAGRSTLAIGFLCDEKEAWEEWISLTSAVLGTLSQKTSILMSPRVVCRVTDMVAVGGAWWVLY